ncbi:MAG: SirB1 family protein [Bryobacteraceae bacterium]
MRELSDLLAGRSDDIELDRAALLLASIEYPALPVDQYVNELDDRAAELARRITPYTDGRSCVLAMNEYLFRELGFRGNTEDYYNPANSCLNDVMTRRTGIPITLSVVYIEIARRLAKPVAGIGLPGHFVVRYDDGAYSTYIDPFHDGRLLDLSGCMDLARTASGGSVQFDGSVLAPVGKRQIIARMINNLRGIYFARRADRKALQVLNLLLDANPASPDEYKQRGLVYLHLQRIGEARADFQRYLELAPNASDREDIEKQLQSIRRWQVGLN